MTDMEEQAANIAITEGHPDWLKQRKAKESAKSYTMLKRGEYAQWEQSLHLWLESGKKIMEFIRFHGIKPTHNTGKPSTIWIYARANKWKQKKHRVTTGHKKFTHGYAEWRKLLYNWLNEGHDLEGFIKSYRLKDSYKRPNRPTLQWAHSTAKSYAKGVTTIKGHILTIGAHNPRGRPRTVLPPSASQWLPFEKVVKPLANSSNVEPRWLSKMPSSNRRIQPHGLGTNEFVGYLNRSQTSLSVIIPNDMVVKMGLHVGDIAKIRIEKGSMKFIPESEKRSKRLC